MRAHLFTRLPPGAIHRVLEVGCGTGAVASQIVSERACDVFGLDIHGPHLRFAHAFDPRLRCTQGDAYQLPYATGCFDVVYCHFLLLWISNIPAVLAEMCRVARPGGWIMALAEPDYGGRIDFPDSLNELGRLQAVSLSMQGARPDTGRRLLSEFLSAGMNDVETGLMGGQWRAMSFDPATSSAEWEILTSDLRDLLPPSRLRAYREVDEAACRKGDRILFVPTFYAIGNNPVVS